MSVDLVANVVIAGVLTGLVYGLMALGLSVIFGVVRVVNFAHGEMMTVAMYAATILFAGFQLDPFLAMLLVAVAIVMVNAMLMFFGPDARNVQLDYQLESFEIGKILIDKARLYAAGAAVVAAAALFCFFRYSLTGKA